MSVSTFDQLKVEVLVLNNCNLIKLPIFDKKFSPIYLDVSNNKLESLQGIYKSVRTLICKFNRIKSLKPL